MRSKETKTKTATHSGGALDQDMMLMMRRLDAQYRKLGETIPAAEITGYEVLAPDQENPLSIIKLFGTNFRPETTAYVNNMPLTTEYVSPTEVRAILPDVINTRSNDFLQITAVNQTPAFLLVQLSGQTKKSAFIAVITAPDIPKTGKPFDITCKFRTPSKVKVSLIRLILTYPNGETCKGDFRVTSKENRDGSKTIPGFTSGIWGIAKLDATLFANDGSIDTYCARFDVVPSNPIQVSVYPQYYGTSWKGAAQYYSSTQRYYCRARVVISNGNNFSITVANTVTAIVTDGGSQIESFSFNLDSPYTVGANSSLTLYVYTYHPKGNDVADVFDEYGDVTIKLRFSTSAGTIEDSAVWVMMAQIKVACNFVGNFSWSEMVAAKNLTLGRASSIYEQKDVQITSAPILEIPSSDSDWSKYRDIKIDSCKNGYSSDEADDMRSGWSSPGTYKKHVDLWFVESFSGASCAATTGGFSPNPGPTSKSGSKSGVVIDVKDLDILNSTWGSNVLGLLIAHELGHYLDLDHVNDADNFMAKSTDGTNTGINWNQHNEMTEHGWVKKINP